MVCSLSPLGWAVLCAASTGKQVLQTTACDCYSVASSQITELETDVTVTVTGKQARAANADDSARTKHEHSPPHSQAHAKQHNMAPAVSEPVYGAGAPRQNHVDAYSTAGDAQNRVAQAGHVAAHHVEPAQGVSSKTKKRVPDENIAKLVAEENADKNKLPRYQGLERWQLVEKMGDGAFSNVYRARDLQGQHGEVAIKVVRKFEMNNMQVRDIA